MFHVVWKSSLVGNCDRTLIDKAKQYTKSTWFSKSAREVKRNNVLVNLCWTDISWLNVHVMSSGLTLLLLLRRQNRNHNAISWLIEWQLNRSWFQPLLNSPLKSASRSLKLPWDQRRKESHRSIFDQEYSHLIRVGGRTGNRVASKRMLFSSWSSLSLLSNLFLVLVLHLSLKNFSVSKNEMHDSLVDCNGNAFGCIVVPKITLR